jgi:hypothetical protein
MVALDFVHSVWAESRPCVPGLAVKIFSSKVGLVTMLHGASTPLARMWCRRTWRMGWSRKRVVVWVGETLQQHVRKSADAFVIAQASARVCAVRCKNGSHDGSRRLSIYRSVHHVQLSVAHRSRAS